jgi:hypothetical protein
MCHENSISNGKSAVKERKKGISDNLLVWQGLREGDDATYRYFPETYLPFVPFLIFALAVFVSLE